MSNNQVQSNEGQQKRTKKAATTGEKTFSVNHDQEQICDFTGDTENECGVIFTTGTINVGRRAIQMLSSQLAQWERQQRG